MTIGSAAVIGSGYMGGGIAQVLALAGLRVSLVDASAAQAAAARDRLVAQAGQFESESLIARGAADAIADRLTAAKSLADAVAEADYITEAVSETAPLKREVLTGIATHARIDAIIATNTSSIPIGSLADPVTAPQRFLGVHWMNPAPFVPAVEIIAGRTHRPRSHRAGGEPAAAGRKAAGGGGRRGWFRG